MGPERWNYLPSARIEITQDSSLASSLKEIGSRIKEQGETGEEGAIKFILIRRVLKGKGV